MECKTIRSYAKINLHLNIKERRADGFHDLTSIFHLVDLYDLITVCVEDGPHCITITGMDEVPLETNLMFKAATRFMNEIKKDMTVQINIEKHIPMQGGLGGGSSNAAAVLDLLNELTGFPLSFDQLFSIGLSLGSDVPFFLYHYQAAIVEGRGEIVRKIEPREDLKIVLVLFKNEGISTATAFRELDERRLIFPALNYRAINANLCQTYEKPVKMWNFINDFSSIVCKYNDLYRELMDLSSAFPNCYGQVSGSGSTYYFLSEKDEIDSLFTYLQEHYATQVTNIYLKCLHRW